VPQRDYSYYERNAKNLNQVNFSRQGNRHFPHSIEYMPYIFLESNFGNLIEKSDRILELGAGIGNMTGYLLEKTEHLTVLDFSANSLEVLKTRWPQVSEIVLANMEDLPFEDNSFDKVVCFAVLSYAKKDKVDLEITRVLKPGGLVIVIDSLRNNPIYLINRLLHAIQGNRSFYSVINMPSKSRIKSWNSYYETLSLNFFGTFAWCKPILSLFWDSPKVAEILSQFDKNKLITNSSFAHKFLYIGREREYNSTNKMLVFQRRATPISLMSTPELQGCEINRVPLNIRNVSRLKFSLRHYFHLFCKFKKGPSYYLFVKRENEVIFRALIHKCVLGGLHSELSKTSISAVYTHPKFRNQGIASYYLTEEIQKILGGQELIWICRPDNFASVNLCAKLGFRQVGFRHTLQTLFLKHWKFQRSITCDKD